MKNGAQHNLDVYLDFMGEDFVAHVIFRITYYGHDSSWDDPGAGPEWETTKIVLYRDVPPWGYGKFEATGELFNALDQNEAICDAICEYIGSRAKQREEDYYCD